MPGSGLEDRSQQGDERRRFDGDRNAFVGEAGRWCSCRGRIASWSRRAAARFLQTWARRSSTAVSTRIYLLTLETEDAGATCMNACARGPTHRHTRVYKYRRDSTRRISNKRAVKCRRWAAGQTLRLDPPTSTTVVESVARYDRLLALTLRPKSELDLKSQYRQSFRWISVKTLEL